jgi:cyclase
VTLGSVFNRAQYFSHAKVGADQMKSKILRAAVLSTSLAVLCGGAHAQENFDNVEIVTTDVGSGIYMFRSMNGETEVGGNMIAAVAGDGVLLIDTNFEPMYAKTKAAIAAITDLPVRFLINTHHHRDHTGANIHFGEEGVTIISHETMRDVLADGSVNGLTGAVLEPASEAAIPTLTYSDEMTFELEGLSAKLFHPADPHTNGDTYVIFPDANVLVTGDIVTFGRYPNIDFALSGHIDRMISVTDEFIAMTDEDSIVVPGHGPVSDRDDLIDYRHMLSTSRDRVKALMDQGQTLDAIIAAQPNADYDRAMNVEQRRIDNWIRVIYYSYRPTEAL